MRTDLSARLAIEALRNGVPNHEAVRELGCNQPRAEARFMELLSGAASEGNWLDSAQGMLVSGDFGTGKSHLLTHFEHLAMDGEFVCSKVAISKETPLYDLGKVFQSAMECGRVPGRRGRFIEELSLALIPGSEEYSAFSRWAEKVGSTGVLSPIFPASLSIHEKSNDFELNGDIEAFWAGDKIRVAEIRRGLREIGELAKYRFRAPKAADLPPQRLKFALELIKCAGFRGWVVLLDEIELIGSYSLLQRGRAYAEIARWMGLVQGEVHPGLIVVGAVTEDFAAAVIGPDGPRRDRDYVVPRLEQSALYKSVGARAAEGMQLLEQGGLALEAPGDEEIGNTMRALGRLYRRAYDWDPPQYEASARGGGYEGRMRYKVRAAINEWDLRRLYPDHRPHTEYEIVKSGYKEDLDLEHETGRYLT